MSPRYAHALLVYYSGTTVVIMFYINFIGDHVRIVKSVYDHHFVVLEVLDETYLTVVHYNAKEALDSFLIFPEICLAFNNFVAMHLWSPLQIWDSASSKSQETKVAGEHDL